jgi:hypothetical protein
MKNIINFFKKLLTRVSVSPTMDLKGTGQGTKPSPGIKIKIKL